jgi:hypothetical protein
LSVSVETDPRTGSARGSELTEEIRLTRRARRQAEGERDAAITSLLPGTSALPAGPDRAAPPTAEAVVPDASATPPRLPRRTPVLHPGRTVYVSSRRALPEAAAWSPRTLLVLAALGVLVLVAGTTLVVRTVTGQRVGAEGSLAAAELSAALETARTDFAVLAEAVETNRPLATYAAGLAEAVAPRAADLSDEAVAAVATAAAELEALVAEPVLEPRLPAALADLSDLPDAFISADAAARADLRERVAAQLDRLPAVGRQAADRADALDDAVGAFRSSIGTAIQVAEGTAQATLGATPEAYGDSRERFVASVAALAALGEVPELDATTRQAFESYFLSADALRRSHEEAVLARELAERQAEEEAAAAAQAAAAEAAEREAAQADKKPWWWGGRDRDGD